MTTRELLRPRLCFVSQPLFSGAARKVSSSGGCQPVSMRITSMYCERLTDLPFTACSALPTRTPVARVSAILTMAHSPLRSSTRPSGFFSVKVIE